MAHKNKNSETISDILTQIKNNIKKLKQMSQYILNIPHSTTVQLKEDGEQMSRQCGCDSEDDRNQNIYAYQSRNL